MKMEPSDETDKVFNNLKRFGQAESISQSSTAPQFVGTKILEAAPSFDLEILRLLEHFIKKVDFTSHEDVKSILHEALG
jgi:hypothetical protein